MLGYKIQIMGIVQGVGFRPFVYNKALANNLKGWVNNCESTVVIMIEGEKNHIKCFIKDIVHNPPSIAYIEKIKIKPCKVKEYKDFSILPSTSMTPTICFLSPDIATCDECMKEVMNPESRRYRYPFTNCTQCGPRYSIIKELPYDRKNTTMSMFPMCTDCEKEYNNPGYRRFHTQPNCCKECGPQVVFIDSNNKKKYDNPIKLAVSKIKQGKIVGVKGLGGFHLCCDAVNKNTINTLRIRKKRPNKPLAIMAKNLESAKKIAYISTKEEQILTGRQKPIVLLKKRVSNILPSNIAPDQRYIGIMLPYTPLHYLLFDESIEYLVMTSGNLNGQPLAYKNNEAIKLLGNICDYFLTHNREIHMPIDDSVVKVIEDKLMVIRLARGYAPYHVKMDSNKEKLALGGQQKSTVCVLKNKYAVISNYIGDLGDYDTYERYQKTIDNILNIYKSTPDRLIHDLHPLYDSTRYAHEQSIRRIGVQHHYAHMLSCMVEHNINKKVIGVIYDGTGLGDDGAIWGGEFLIGDRKSYKRAAHLKYVTLQGGDITVKEPWRSGVSFLVSSGIEPEKYIKGVNRDRTQLLKEALNSDFNCFQSSSMGRFFDGVSALIGLCNYNTYDGEAAIILENNIEPGVTQLYSYNIDYINSEWLIDYGKIIQGIIDDMEQGISIPIMSSKFHNTVIDFTVNIVDRLSEESGIVDVVLSGGVFQNSYLLSGIYRRLKGSGFNTYFNEMIPINDGGLSLGQIAIEDDKFGGGK
ncbi:carbamoyltransferase HypF [Vallitalea guaymasensis]|uniref:carbamoyltransferase HypF n=1 Tax=Vallitalea guaymasensis TaxID=1185412 RepID=UPI002353A4D8|nr:carbamoyltransferase HypF [Vallitalea guaymasensis]